MDDTSEDNNALRQLANARNAAGAASADSNSLDMEVEQEPEVQQQQQPDPIHPLANPRKQQPPRSRLKQMHYFTWSANSRGQPSRSSQGSRGSRKYRTASRSSSRRQNIASASSFDSPQFSKSSVSLEKPEVNAATNVTASTSGLHFDLPTIRKDLELLKKSTEDKDDEKTIRPPQQDVFRVHKPQFHISTENVWFPRLEIARGGVCGGDYDFVENESMLVECNGCESSNENGEESTTLAEEEVEVKLPCKSVTINVVGMPSSSEVNSRPPPASLPLEPLKILSRPPPIYPRFSTSINGDLLFNQRSSSMSSFFYGMGGGGATSKADFYAKDSLYYRVSPCCRYRKPAFVSLMAVSFLMIVTLSVLYWNYHETMHRRSTKKQGIILDHWGKGAPSAAEIEPLDYEVAKMKREQEEAQRSLKKKGLEFDTSGFMFKDINIDQGTLDLKTEDVKASAASFGSSLDDFLFLGDNKYDPQRKTNRPLKGTTAFSGTSGSKTGGSKLINSLDFGGGMKTTTAPTMDDRGFDW